VTSQGLIKLSGFQSSSGQLKVQSETDYVSIQDAEITVNSNISTAQTKYAFQVISKTSYVSVSGRKAFNVRDIYIFSALNTDIGNMVAMLTNYANSVSPAIRIEAMERLTFNGPAALSGGHIFLRGYRGVAFLDQTSLLATF